MSNLKELALESHRKLAENQAASEEAASEGRRKRAAALFEKSFGLSPDKVEGYGTVYSGDLVLHYVTPEHYERFALQVTCPDCGEEVFTEDFYPSLENLGQAIVNGIPHYSHTWNDCPARKRGREVDSAGSWEHRLAQAIRDAMNSV